MTYLIIIFFVSLAIAFMMLNYSAWQVKNGERGKERTWMLVFPPIRHIEKYLLYFLKHFIQKVILFCVKYWFLFITKIKKWIIENWPKIKNRFSKNKKEEIYPKSPSFLRRAVFESKVKIKRIRQKIKEENDLNR